MKTKLIALFAVSALALAAPAMAQNGYGGHQDNGAMGDQRSGDQHTDQHRMGGGGGYGMGGRYHHHHRVCVWRRHHQVCTWR